MVLDPAGVEAGARRAEKAVENLGVEAEDAAEKVDNLNVAVDDVGVTATEAAEKIVDLNRKTSDVATAQVKAAKSADDAGKSFSTLDRASNALTGRFNSLAKATVGLFVFDFAAKVAGFSSAMDALGKASQFAAEKLQQAVGLDTYFERLASEKKAIEESAGAWTRLAEARKAANDALTPEGIKIEPFKVRIEDPYDQSFGGLLPPREGRGPFELGTEGAFIPTYGLTQRQKALVQKQIDELFQSITDVAAEAAADYQPQVTPGTPGTFFKFGTPKKTTFPTREEVQGPSQELIDDYIRQIELTVQSLKEENHAINDHATALARANEKGRLQFEESQEIERKRILASDQNLELLNRINERRREQVKKPYRIPDQRGIYTDDIFGLQGAYIEGPIERADRIESRRREGDLSQFNVAQYRSPAADDLKQADRENEKYLDRLKEIKRTYDDLGAIGAYAFEDFISGARKASEAAKALGRDIALYVLRQLVTIPLAAGLSSGLQSLFPGLGGALTPRQSQHGSTIYQPSIVTPIGGGRSTLIAEGGPEDIVPSYARGARGARGGRGLTIVVNATKGDDSWRRSLRQVVHDVKRGGL